MTSCLFITANVGSICEAPKLLLPQWVNQLCQTIACIQPGFIAMHCQEIGGKDFKTNMRNVDEFVRHLLSSEPIRQFDSARIFIDQDHTSPEKFTALGNFYFIKSSLSHCQIWNFKTKSFNNVADKDVFIGNIEEVPTKEKRKFPQEFFPDYKWSRKGYMRTRWSINGTVIDLVNFHLFHDASNLVSIEKQPSSYCLYRRRALAYTLNRFKNDDLQNVPFFIFGDFNFRPNTQAVVESLTSGMTKQLQNDKNGEEALYFYDAESKPVLILGKKQFQHDMHQHVFYENSLNWLQKYDIELGEFQDCLFEFPISFPPSYPFSEEPLEPNLYMQTRCPSWCDRILLSNTAKELCLKDSSRPSGYDVIYDAIGQNTCMGDHKPVFLSYLLKAHSENLYGSFSRTKVCMHSSKTSSLYSDPATVTIYFHSSCGNPHVRSYRETSV